MVKIQELLQKNGIIINLTGVDKIETIKSMARFLCMTNGLQNDDEVANKIIEREMEISTGIGYGIAIPHARLAGIDKLYMIAARHPEGLEFNSLDEQAVNLIFMMVSPASTSTEHTQVLSTLSQIMSYEDVRTKLMQTETSEEFIEVITNAENKYVGAH